jgi:hypothetical protein
MPPASHVSWASRDRFRVLRGTTLTDLIEDGLRERVARRSATHERPQPLRLPVVHGNGPRPGVDLDDSAALGNLLDGLDDPA